MATPQEKLAESLDALKALQDRDIVAIQGADLSRAHRERLLKNGFFREVIKGWYITARPDDAAGESTAWYASFWDFCAAYLRERFGSRWCSVTKAFSVTAYRESSGTVSAGGALSQGGNKPTTLAHGTSLLEVRSALPKEKDIEERDGRAPFVLAAHSADRQLAGALCAQYNRRSRSRCGDP